MAHGGDGGSAAPRPLECLRKAPRWQSRLPQRAVGVGQAGLLQHGPLPSG
jgi:hypothetical protein